MIQFQAMESDVVQSPASDGTERERRNTLPTSKWKDPVGNPCLPLCQVNTAYADSPHYRAAARDRPTATLLLLPALSFEGNPRLRLRER